MITEVKTKYGTLRGVTSNGGHALFKGIRYAKAPVGSLRFAPPEEPDWIEGTVLCDIFGPAAPQAPFSLIDESGHPRKNMPGYPYPPRMDEISPVSEAIPTAKGFPNGKDSKETSSRCI